MSRHVTPHGSFEVRLEDGRVHLFTDGARPLVGDKTQFPLRPRDAINLAHELLRAAFLACQP